MENQPRSDEIGASSVATDPASRGDDVKNRSSDIAELEQDDSSKFEVQQNSGVSTKLEIEQISDEDSMLEPQRLDELREILDEYIPEQSSVSMPENQHTSDDPTDGNSSRADDERSQHGEAESEAENEQVVHETRAEITEISQDFSEAASDAPPSPASVETSGYLGGSGSTSASTSGTDIDAADQERKRLQIPPHRGRWMPGKRHADEDDTVDSWRQHNKHFFILSNAGKPVYSRYGDEHKLAGFSATLQAIMSFVESSGDRLHLVRAGNYQFVFIIRGPLYLVSISATDEPFQALKRQLELLHRQVFLILTKTIERCFTKNANFDMRPLLGGTDSVFSSLIHSFNWNPTTFLNAYACLALPYAARQTAGAALQDVAEAGVLFALLMCGHKVINMVGPRKASLHPDDLFLLSNFISSSDSFRTTESFSPVCLPHYMPNAFLYAYVHYLSDDVYVILISGNVDSFFHMKDCRGRVEIMLRKSRVLQEASRSVTSGGLLVHDVPSDNPQDGFSSKKSADRGMHIADRAALGGPAGLWHFIYRSTFLDQYLAAEFTPPLHTYQAQKRLFRAYQRIYFSMHDENGGHHKMQYRRDENYVLMYWRTSDFELYAAFDPLAEKSSAIRVCNQICAWIRNLESEVFLLGATPFNW